MDAIKTEGLTKYYGKARGIENLDLAVEQGEFFGFIGPNGADKSTTIRTLLGLIAPTAGRATVLGKDVGRQATAILRDVGYLPSETVCYPGMKVRDVLKFSADLRGLDCGAEAARLCERLQLDPTARVDALSYGNRKKVGIVCALQAAPALLILDEPTGGLDPLMQREFFTILRERNQSGTTVFLSSHVLSEVQRNCTRAAAIRAGRIIACDRVEDLVSSGARRVTIHGSVDLSGLEGIRDRKDTEGAVSFLYNGGMDDLLKTLAQGKVSDLSVSEPDLEELFLHFYEGGEAV